MVDMNSVREMVNNPDMPLAVIEMAFSYLSIADREAIVKATTAEERNTKEWGKLILDMRQQDVKQLMQEAADLLKLNNRESPSAPLSIDDVINLGGDLRTLMADQNNPTDLGDTTDHNGDGSSGDHAGDGNGLDSDRDHADEHEMKEEGRR